MKSGTLGLLMAVLISAAGSRANADITFLVSVDSSALANGTQGYLDFQFNAGDSSAQSATAAISNFASTGVTLGGADLSGALSGTSLAPGTIVLGNALALNEIFQGATFGSGSEFSFDVTLGGPAINAPSGVAPFGTTFSFNVLDTNDDDLLPVSAPIDPLVTIDVAPITGFVSVTSLVPSVVSVVPEISGPGGGSGTVLTGSVPEPGSIVLTGIWLVVIVALRLCRRRGRRMWENAISSGLSFDA